MGKYFGTDGFRGEANKTLTAGHAYKVGRFLGWYYGELKRRAATRLRPGVVIGKDTRRSSYMFEYALVAGLTASGADAYLLHVTTTPSVAYIARVDSFDCGIHDFRQPQSLLRQRHQINQQSRRKDRRKDHRARRKLSRRKAGSFRPARAEVPYAEGRENRAHGGLRFRAAIAISATSSLWECTRLRE